jgi:hypothetical protein
MLPSLSEKDLQPYFNKEELIRQAALQLQKDMAIIGEEITFTRIPISFDELLSQTEPLIKKLFQSRHERLVQLLYRIDVNENFVAEAVVSGGEMAGRITRLILLRELQKVVMRESYEKRK